jgi:hypothetical protein
MFEHRQQPLLPTRQFYHRMARSTLAGLSLVAISLVIGTVGYRVFESLSWLDAYVNAAMLLSGEGPLAPLKTAGGKLFAGTYAIYCGIALITSTAVMFAPVVHRIFHKFHLADENFS